MTEDLPPIPQDVAQLLKATPRPAPPPGFEAEVWARVAASAAGVAGTATAAHSLVGLGKTLGMKAGLLWVGTLAVGAGLGIAVDRTLLAPAPPPPEIRIVYKEARTEMPAPAPVPANPPRAEPAPPASAPKWVQPHLVPAPTPVPSAPAPAQVSAPPMKSSEPETPVESHPSPTKDRLLAQERAIIEMGRSALARGENALAQSHFERHWAEFANGQLAEEREALWIAALAGLGKRNEALERAADFERRFPESLLGSGVREAIK